MHQDVRDYGNYVVLNHSNSVVLSLDTSDTIPDFDVAGFTVTPIGMKKQIEFMPRGNGNHVPLDIIRKSAKNVTISTNPQKMSGRNPQKASARS